MGNCSTRTLLFVGDVCEILSNTVLLEWASKMKNCNINCRISRFQIKNHDIMLTNNKHLPYERSCTAGPYFCIVNCTSTKNWTIQYANLRNMDTWNAYKPQK
jgi:hypothetical protein